MAFCRNLLSALIEKLMGVDNYGTWRLRVKNLLMLNDLWSYVDGTTIRDLANAKLQAEFDAKSRITLSLINL